MAVGLCLAALTLLRAPRSRTGSSSTPRGTLSKSAWHPSRQFHRQARAGARLALALAPDGKTVAVLRAFQDTRLLGFSGKTLTTLHLHVFDATDPPAKPAPRAYFSR